MSQSTGRLKCKTLGWNNALAHVLLILDWNIKARSAEIRGRQISGWHTLQLNMSIPYQVQTFEADNEIFLFLPLPRTFTEISYVYR